MFQDPWSSQNGAYGTRGVLLPLANVMAVLLSPRVWPTSGSESELGSALEGGVLDSGLGLKLREGVYLRSELNGGFRRDCEVKGKKERKRVGFGRRPGSVWGWA